MSSYRIIIERKILIQRLGIEIEDEADEDKFSSNSNTVVYV
jgi:hypothetical protein